MVGFPKSGHIYIKLAEFKRFVILKKGIGIEVKIYANNLMIKKLWKQDGTQSYGCYRKKLILKHLLSLF